MANFVWIFAFLCVQFCRGEEVVAVNDIADTPTFPVKDDSEAIKPEDAWTEEDEKWFQEIQSLLAGDSDEDYDVESDFWKLISDIEELMKEHMPEKSDYEWLVEIWQGLSDESDYEDESAEKDSGAVDDLMLSKAKTRRFERPGMRKFSSV